MYVCEMMGNWVPLDPLWISNLFTVDSIGFAWGVILLRLALGLLPLRQLQHRVGMIWRALFLVVVDAVVIRRRWGVRARHGGPHASYAVVIEHGHELVVVEPVEIGPAARAGGGECGGGVAHAAALLHHGGLEEGDGVAHGAAVGAAPGRREVEKLVDPGWGGGGGGGVVDWQSLHFLIGEVWPIWVWGDGRHFGR